MGKSWLSGGACEIAPATERVIACPDHLLPLEFPRGAKPTRTVPLRPGQARVQPSAVGGIEAIECDANTGNFGASASHREYGTADGEKYRYATTGPVAIGYTSAAREFARVRNEAVGEGFK